MGALRLTVRRSTNEILRVKDLKINEESNLFLYESFETTLAKQFVHLFISISFLVFRCLGET